MTFSGQISVDYVGNAKAFATLEGTRTPDHGRDVSASTISEGDHGGLLGPERSRWLTYLHGSQWLGTVTKPTHRGGVIERHEQSHEEIFITLESRVIYFYGGAGDPILSRSRTTRARRFESKTMNTKAHGLGLSGEYVGFDEIPEITYGTAFIHAGDRMS